MGFFNRKPKVIKEIQDGVWGHMVSVHKIDVDTLSKEIRCVERKGTLSGGQVVTFLRIFRLSEVVKRGIEIEGWETFDQYPDLILYEGHLALDNTAYIERKTGNPNP
ncbi:MAG: hypothetical protein HYX87_02845 [Chloroflexi bacterium]|nr:hypothetical protein [Chloroflexota bacterium]